MLIKVVAQSIPTYTMGVFQLPIKLCNELNAMCARFGGVKWAMKGRFIGKIGSRCLNQRRKVGWDLETSGVLIWQC